VGTVDLGTLRGQGRQLPGLGQVLQAVLEQVDPGVDLLDVQQLQLGESIGLQGGLLVLVRGPWSGADLTGRCGSPTDR
jgi:hypothetical protein